CDAQQFYCLCTEASCPVCGSLTKRKSEGCECAGYFGHAGSPAWIIKGNCPWQGALNARLRYESTGHGNGWVSRAGNDCGYFGPSPAARSPGPCKGRDQGGAFRPAL